MLKDVFGFVEHREKATCGSEYYLILTKKSVISVMKEANATNDAKIKKISIECNDPHHAPSME